MPASIVKTSFMATIAALVAGAALAAGLTGAAAVKDRQAHMKALGTAAKALAEQVRSGAPDPAVVKLQTARMAALADAMPHWFPVGSGKEAKVKTGALALIWTDPAAFAAVEKRLAAGSAALNAAASGGDMAAFRAQLRPTLGACKSCHEKFREPEKS